MDFGLDVDLDLHVDAAKTDRDLLKVTLAKVYLGQDGPSPSRQIGASMQIPSFATKTATISALLGEAGAMTNHDWVKEFPVAITVVNAEGIILEMNDKSAVTFAAGGGMDLMGTNSLECHPEPSRTKLRQLLREQKSNLYTIEKAGIKKLICQIPWLRDGRFSGLVELAIELPAELPHFVRG